MNSSSVLNYSLNLFKPITDPIIQFGISHNIPSSTISFISILCSFLLFILSLSFLASSLEQNALARQNKNKWSDTNFRRAKEAQLKSLKAKRAGRMREIREEPVVKEKPKSTIEGLDINFDSVFSEEASVNAVTEKIQAVDLNAKEIESPTNLVESETGSELDNTHSKEDTRKKEDTTNHHSEDTPKSEEPERVIPSKFSFFNWFETSPVNS